MSRIYGGRAHRLLDPRKTIEYKKVTVKVAEDGKGWAACCPTCNWVGSSYETAEKKINFQGVDGIGFYVMKGGVLRLCPECLKKDLLSEVFDPNEDDN